MELTNKQVMHKSFGIGEIVNKDSESNILSIQFSDDSGIKQFVYPDAFDKYLKICDSSIEGLVLNDLNIRKAEIEAEIVKKQQLRDEEIKQKALEQIELLAQKKKKAPKKPADKKQTKKVESSQASI